MEDSESKIKNYLLNKLESKHIPKKINFLEDYIKIQIIKTEFLKFLDVLNNNQINYWADGGTLLGTIRHQGIIPWDKDVDIAFNPNEKAKLLEIVLQSEDWYLIIWPDKKHPQEVTQLSHLYPSRHPVLYNRKYTGVVIADIFFYPHTNLIPDIYKNHPKVNPRDGFYKVENYPVNRWVYPVTGFELIKKPFHDRFINVPKNYQVYFETNYGEQWMSHDYFGSKILDFSPFDDSLLGQLNLVQLYEQHIDQNKYTNIKKREKQYFNQKDNNL